MDRAVYRQSLIDGYESELMADAMLEVVCEKLGADDPHYSAIRTIQRLEITFAEMMKQMLQSHGLEIPDGKAPRSAGIEVSAQLGSWAQIQESTRIVMPPVVERFDELARHAEAADKDRLEKFALHERLLLQLGEAQLHEDPLASEQAILKEIERLIADVADMTK